MADRATTTIGCPDCGGYMFTTTDRDEECPRCNGRGLIDKPAPSPPAQAATEVTHEQAREHMKVLDGFLNPSPIAGHHRLATAWYGLLSYIDQQTRRDAAAQVPQAAPRVEGGMRERLSAAIGRWAAAWNRSEVSVIGANDRSTLLDDVVAIASEARAAALPALAKDAKMLALVADKLRALDGRGKWGTDNLPGRDLERAVVVLTAVDSALAATGKGA